MKLLLSLLAGFCVTSLVSAQEPAASLDLSKAPTFGEMTKAGMKFEIPGWLVKDRMPGVRSRRASNQNLQGQPAQPAPRRATEIMDAEPLPLALAKGSGNSGAIEWSSIQCEFPSAELTDPGKYYPPKLPVGDETKIARIHLAADSEDAAALIKQAAETLKMLGISDPKLDSWISMEMWKNSPAFDASYEAQVPKVKFGIKVDREERENNTTAFIYLVVGDWEEPAK